MTRLIETNRTQFGVAPTCRVLQIAPSTYCADRRRLPSAREQRDQQLSAEVRRVHAEHFGVYGVRKAWRQLQREGQPVPAVRLGG